MSIKIDLRKKIFGFLSDHWWVFILAIFAIAYITKSPILNLLMYGVGFVIALLFFGPYILMFLYPVFVLLSSLIMHLKESQGQSFGKRFLLMPVTIISICCYFMAQVIMSVWITVITFIMWSTIFGSTIAFIAIFIFGMLPLAIIATPFIAWYQFGIEALGLTAFFFLAFLWQLLSIFLQKNDDSKLSTYEVLGYSSHIFLFGALSLLIIAIPFYHFNYFGVGVIISDGVSWIFMVLAIFASLKMSFFRKKMTKANIENLDSTSKWYYLLGFIVTSLLFGVYKQYDAPVVLITWLNAYYLFVMIKRSIGYFRRKEPHQTNVALINESPQIEQPPFSQSVNISHASHAQISPENKTDEYFPHKYYCKICGQKITNFAAFCSNCGSKQ